MSFGYINHKCNFRRTGVRFSTVNRIARKYAEDIRKRLTDYGYKEGLVYLYVIGGSGCLLKNYINLAAKPEITFVTIFVPMPKDMKYWLRRKHEDKPGNGKGKVST